MSSQFRKLVPLMNRVLIKKFEPVSQTKSGIILNSKEQVSNVGEVIAVGAGNVKECGTTIPVAVKKGNKVLLPEFGGQKIDLNGAEYFIYRDTELVGVLEE